MLGIQAVPSYIKRWTLVVADKVLNKSIRQFRPECMEDVDPRALVPNRASFMQLINEEFLDGTPG